MPEGEKGRTYAKAWVSIEIKQKKERKKIKCGL